MLRRCYNKFRQEGTAVSRLTAKLSKVMSLLDFYLEENLDFLNNTRAAIMLLRRQRIPGMPPMTRNGI